MNEVRSVMICTRPQEYMVTRPRRPSHHLSKVTLSQENVSSDHLSLCFLFSDCLCCAMYSFLGPALLRNQLSIILRLLVTTMYVQYFRLSSFVVCSYVMSIFDVHHKYWSDKGDYFVVRFGVFVVIVA